MSVRNCDFFHFNFWDSDQRRARIRRSWRWGWWHSNSRTSQGGLCKGRRSIWSLGIVKRCSFRKWRNIWSNFYRLRFFEMFLYETLVRPSLLTTLFTGDLVIKVTIDDLDLKAKWSKPLPVTGIGKPLDSSQDPSFASLSHIWEGGARSGDSGDRDHHDLKKGYKLYFSMMVYSKVKPVII